VNGGRGCPPDVIAADSQVGAAEARSQAAYASLNATLATPEQRRLLLAYADAEAEAALALARQYVQRLIAHLPEGRLVRLVADRCLPPDGCRCFEQGELPRGGLDL